VTGSARLRLGRRQGVAAALQVEPADDVEAHDRAPDIVLGVSAGERRDDRGSSVRTSGVTHSMTASRSAENMGRDDMGVAG
jgi:hypothetical protein